MNKLYVVRHGQTDFNQQGRYMGSTDVSLNEEGICQAENLANQLCALSIGIIHCSPLKRAMETARIIQAKTTSNIVIDKSLTERNVGIYEGLTKEEIKERYPELFAKNITRIMHEAPPEGETAICVIQRVHDALIEIIKRNEAENILIVTHGFVSKAINKFFNPNISDQEFFEFTIPNAGIAEYAIEKS